MWRRCATGHFNAKTSARAHAREACTRARRAHARAGSRRWSPHTLPQRTPKHEETKRSGVAQCAVQLFWRGHAAGASCSVGIVGSCRVSCGSCAWFRMHARSGVDGVSLGNMWRRLHKLRKLGSSGNCIGHRMERGDGRSAFCSPNAPSPSSLRPSRRPCSLMHSYASCTAFRSAACLSLRA